MNENNKKLKRKDKKKLILNKKIKLKTIKK